MNKELELEAEKANGYAYYGKPLGEKYLAFNEGFIAGATSNWIEKQKLQFAIGLLKVIEQPNGDLLGNKIKQQIIILEQKLSEL